MRRFWSVLCFCLISLQFFGKDNSNTNVVILGDSNTYIGGDACDNDKGWNKWFKDFFAPATCWSYARSGATWTNTKNTCTDTEQNIAVLGDDNVIYNQVRRLEKAYNSGNQVSPDIVIIACGTNDAWFSDKRPGLYMTDVSQAFLSDVDELLKKSPSDVLSLAESVRYDCELLRRLFPHAQIILLTPLQSTAAGIAGITKVGDMIQQCADKLGLPVIRQDKVCCVRSAKESQRRHYTTDGTHTNTLGAKTNGRIIAMQIKRLIK